MDEEVQIDNKIQVDNEEQIEDEDTRYDVETVIDARYKFHDSTWEYLVHWKGYPHSEDSWISDIEGAEEAVLLYWQKTYLKEELQKHSLKKSIKKKLEKHLKKLQKKHN